MKQRIRELICFAIGHAESEGVEVWAGWAVWKCQRCRAIVWTELLKEPPA